jgi:hypothetical protein
MTSPSAPKDDTRFWVTEKFGFWKAGTLGADSRLCDITFLSRNIDKIRIYF